MHGTIQMSMWQNFKSNSCVVYDTELNKVYIKNEIPDNQFFNLQNIGNSVDGKSHYTHAATLSGKGV